MTVTVLPLRPALEMRNLAIILSGMGWSTLDAHRQLFSGQPHRVQCLPLSVENTVRVWRLGVIGEDYPIQILFLGFDAHEFVGAQPPARHQVIQIGIAHGPIKFVVARRGLRAYRLSYDPGEEVAVSLRVRIDPLVQTARLKLRPTIHAVGNVNVDGARLSNAVQAADALLQQLGIARQPEKHEVAGKLEVPPLTADFLTNQDARATRFG